MDFSVNTYSVLKQYVLHSQGKLSRLTKAKMRGVYVFHEVLLHERSLHEKCLLGVQQNIVLLIFLFDFSK